MNPNFTRPRYFRDDALFSVEHNGQHVIAGITREQADLYLYGPARLRGSVRVYLTAKPLADRKPAWHKQPIPRPLPLRVSSAYRQRLLDRLRLDGTMLPDAMPEYDRAVYA